MLGAYQLQRFNIQSLQYSNNNTSTNKKYMWCVKPNKYVKY